MGYTFVLNYQIKYTHDAKQINGYTTDNVWAINVKCVGK